MPRVIKQSDIVAAAVDAIKKCNGNRSEAAKLLGINYHTLLYRVRDCADVPGAVKGRKSKNSLVDNIKKLVNCADVSLPASKTGSSGPVISNAIASESFLDYSVKSRPNCNILVSKSGIEIDLTNFYNVCFDKIEISLWIDYWNDNSHRNRNNLVNFYYSWCKDLAYNVLINVPNFVDKSCFVQSAFIGMIDSIAKYNGSTKFTTFSVLRIRGAIHDESREWDIVPRLSRVRQKKRLKLIEDGLNPEEHMTAAEYADSFPDCGFISLDNVVTSDNRDVTLNDTLADDDVIVGDFENDGNFRALCRGCLLEEEVLLYLYYVKEQNMSMIGKVLNLSESRVSQMHSALIKRLAAVDLTSYL